MGCSKQVNSSLVQYVEENIFPIYEKCVDCHGVSHIKEVISKSMDFIPQASEQSNEPISADMVYAIGAFHDLGMIKDRKTHHIISAEMLLADKYIKNFFNAEQLETMAIAIQDHRASLDSDPRNIYGKIVSTADRSWCVDDFLLIVYRWRIKNFPEESFEEMVDDAYAHTLGKYGKQGYGIKKVYFKSAEFENFKKQIAEITSCKEKFREKFLQVISSQNQCSLLTPVVAN